MAKFRKKPVVIDAIQISPNNLDEVSDFMGGESNRNIAFGINYKKHSVAIKTLEGIVTGQCGDWIIKGVAGEFYPCRPDIFAATYERAEAEHEG